MKIRIAKTFDFDAAHFLPLVPDGHKCKRMHGHTYRVEVMCEGEPDERGMVVDYAEIAAAFVPIHDAIDHRTLNEIPGLENPTTECLASWLMARISLTVRQVVAVRVYESATTWCEVAPEVCRRFGKVDGEEKMTTEELIQRLEKALEPKTTWHAKPDLFNPGIDTVVAEVEQSLWCLADCRSALAELKRLSASLAEEQ